ncbi:MAG: AsmA family protein [Elusimicrobia bacterium]|nr:AsmA family protein [Elusimicrobiota bacterium]
MRSHHPHHTFAHPPRRRSFLSRTLRFLIRLGARAVGAVLLFIVLCGLAIYLTVRGMLDPEQVKSLLIDQLQEALHRPVQIEGVVLTPRGIKLKGLRVIERLDIPGHALLDSDFVLITLKPLPLLEGAVRLKSVVLVSPRISVVRSESGEWSVSDIFSSTSPASMSWGPFLLKSLAADRTRIEGGLLRVDDRLSGTKHVIERFGLTVDDFRLDGPFSFDLSFDNVSSVAGKETATSWAAKGLADLAMLDPAGFQIAAPRMTVSIDGLKLSGSAGMRNLREPALDVTVNAPEVTRERWLKYLAKAPDLSLPPSSWKAKLRYDRAARRLEVSGLAVKAGPLAASCDALVDLSSATGPSSSLEVSLDEFPLTAASRFTGFFAPYRLEGRVRGRAGLSVKPGSVEVLRGNVAWRGGRGLFRGHAFGGDVDVTASDALKKVDVSVKAGTLGTEAGPLTDIVLAAGIRGRDLKVEGLRFQWGGSDVKLKALVRNYAKPKEVVLDAKVDRLQWETLSSIFQTSPAESGAVSTATVRGGVDAKGGTAGKAAAKIPWVQSFKYSIPKGFPDTAGRIEVGDIVHDNFRAANFVMLWELRGVTPTLKKVRGDAKVSFGPGRFADIPALQGSSKVMKVALMPFVFMHRLNNLSVFSEATAMPKTMDFERIAGEYEFADGAVVTRYFTVDSPQMVAYSDGQLDFGRETVDMKILTRLTKSRAGTLPEFYMCQSGLVCLKIAVKGNLNSPNPDYGKMAHGELEAAREGIKSRAKKEFRAEEKVRAL